jgi:hypothetical protein
VPTISSAGTSGELGLWGNAASFEFVVNSLFGHPGLQSAELCLHGFDFAWIKVRRVERQVQLIRLAPDLPPELGGFVVKLLVELVELGPLLIGKIAGCGIALPAISMTARPSLSTTKGPMGKDRDG